MWQDPIVKEVRKIRRETESRYGSDAQAYFEHLKAIQARYRDKLVQKKEQKLPLLSREQPAGN